MRGAIAAVGNTFKVSRDIVIQRAVLGKVELVTIPVRVGAASMARLGAASDGDGAVAGLLERNDRVDSSRVDTIKRGARLLVAV